MPDSSVQRAELLADLGRYDEAAAELTDARADDVTAHTLLARVKHAAGDPKAALAAADAAVAADPTDLDAMVARGMVLADLGRVDQAAAQAEQILRQGSGSGYACTSAAAILSQVRNGQAALDAAWQGVRLTPEQPRAHLVLGVVAAGLGLDDIAQRAYREALTLDPGLPGAQATAGVVRVEQQRYVRVLSRFGDPDARAMVPPPPRAEAPAPAASRATAGRAMRIAAAYAVAAPLLTGWAYLVGVGAGVTAVLLASVGVAGGVAGWLGMPAPARATVRARVSGERAPAVAAATVAAVPVLLLVAAGTGAAWPVIGAGAAGVVAVVSARAAG